ncbi:hypothetical protein [Sphingomonas sp. 3-13AW]|uniref:hypothetical protein n=1 Tax=Sphingomonas sp. 3-13AW TaxID=3050450 RepID=UPI003BB51663
MTKKKTRPDFTRAETYMKDQVPSHSDHDRRDVETTAARYPATTPSGPKRKLAFRIAGAFAVAGIFLIILADRYGPTVDAIAGVLAAFAIAATIHALQPRPLLRFGLVVIALACIAVTFAAALHIHLTSVG